MKAMASGAGVVGGVRATGFEDEYTVVGSVEAVDAARREIWLSTTGGRCVEVVVTPLAALRSRRRRGLAWSESKAIRLTEVETGVRAVVRGSFAEDGATLRAASVLVGDIARFACGTVAEVDGSCGEVTIGFADAATITVVLRSPAAVRELDSGRPEPPADEATIDRLSTPRDIWCLIPGDFVLVLVEPAPPGARPFAEKIVRLPSAAHRWR